MSAAVREWVTHEGGQLGMC